MFLPEKLWSLTATEILRLTKSDKVTVEDYAKAVISRIELRDGLVKAWKYFGRPSALPNMQSYCLILIPDSKIILNHARAFDQVPPA